MNVSSFLIRCTEIDDETGYLIANGDIDPHSRRRFENEVVPVHLKAKCMIIFFLSSLFYFFFYLFLLLSLFYSFAFLFINYIFSVFVSINVLFCQAQSCESANTKE